MEKCHTENVYEENIFELCESPKEILTELDIDDNPWKVNVSSNFIEF